MEDVYRNLVETMSRRGGEYPGLDIPEFYDLAGTLFTPEEAELSNVMPKGYFTAEMLSGQLGRPAEKIAAVLEDMADKGTVTSALVDGTRFYGGPPFVPGIFEYQFMRGTRTEKDRRIARLIHAYKQAVIKEIGYRKTSYPVMRVIPVDRKVKSGTLVHTYDQVAEYINNYDPISVATCFCRHEAELLDENDTCGKPNEVCMQFGMAAQFVAERKMGRIVDKSEALDILKKSEDAGLVHCSQNMQTDITFLCNCCSCHCMILKAALAQPVPSQVIYSGFMPEFDHGMCTGCGTCADRCPGGALELQDGGGPVINMDRCFGCGVCATGCPADAISMTARPGVPEPPTDRKSLRDALKANRAA